jgi:5'-nucleotidase/UDP-sugar diphosphatase
MHRIIWPGFLALAQVLAGADFTATLLHVNDTHARVEPTMIQGKPYGGMARLATLIEKYRKSDPNVLFLHAGDAFQGTIYFNVYEGLADLAYLNAMHLDAMAPGNHEFDRGPAVLAAFTRSAQFPLISANLDVDAEPRLKGQIGRSVILTRGGERIGVVGATTSTLPEISRPGPNVHMRDLNASIQAEVDALAKAGVNKIVLLAHVGYTGELELAKNIRGVDVVVGGHSHTLLGTTTAPGFPESRGPYPTVVTNADGGKALVVQSWEGEKVLGRLTITFDGKGHVKKWGNAAPVLIDENVAEDPALKAMTAAFQKPIAKERDRRVAVASDAIPQSAALGEKIADAMLDATASQKVVVALVNSGGVRAALEKGDITFGNALSILPFNNRLVVMDLTGAQLKRSLEDIVEAERSRTLWVSAGTRYTLDPSKRDGSRISDLTLGGRPVDPAATYRVCVNDFLADGGDGLITLKNSTGYRYDTGLLDIDAFLEYLTKHSPITRVAEGRVTRVGK